MISFYQVLFKNISKENLRKYFVDDAKCRSVVVVKGIGASMNDQSAKFFSGVAKSIAVIVKAKLVLVVVAARKNIEEICV